MVMVGLNIISLPAAFEDVYTTIVLVSSDTYPIFYVYNDPAASTTPGSHSDYSYGTQSAVLKTYGRMDYQGSTYFYDGQHWIPIEYTDQQKLEHNKNYVLTQDTALYQYPIQDNQYRKRTILYGERITVLQICSSNQNWGYTGEGWVYLEGNTSLVE